MRSNLSYEPGGGGGWYRLGTQRADRTAVSTEDYAQCAHVLNLCTNYTDLLFG